VGTADELLLLFLLAGNEYQQCGLVAPDEQPQPGTQAAAALAAAAAAAHGSSSGTEGLLAAAAAAVAKAAGRAGAAVNGNIISSRSLQRSDTAESSANGAANGAAGDAYNYSSVYGVLPAARDILVPRACMPGMAVKQVRGCGRKLL
jgi:hypothetical protein